MAAHFDYLTGVVSVATPLPTELADDLMPFFEAPNDPRWRDALSRTLYHETLHFWQLLSSGYLANIAGEEWARMKSFEETGAVPPIGDMSARVREVPDGFPFDAFRLMEGWTRYWDVHTGGAAGSLTGRAGEEGFSKDPYGGIAFDQVVMSEPGSEYYGAVYRWMFEITKGDSRFIVLVFPILAFAAFQTPDPVRIFCIAFERAWNSDFIRSEVQKNRAGLVNIDWCVHWGGPLRQAVDDAKREVRDTRFSSGFDVIHRGLLADHPVYADYLSRSHVLDGRIKLLPAFEDWPPARMQQVFRSMTLGLPVAPGEGDGLLEPLMIYNAKADHRIVFGLPGQPTFRWLLGKVLPPPRVRFSDAVRDADYSTLTKLQYLNEGRSPGDYGAMMDNWEARAAAFQSAEAAVRLGLPPDAFAQPKAP
ncbi:hypothetical protein [Rhizobium sp. BK251]|uniref:hypothetical protein n=1 Tax=Rhizobium sp. BK251 TaxID=2512125 RepID=UPI0010496A9D|nr:hypothetical protein [Rhizobium sp. BK251]TCL74053.1 hypothetical protein EV286_103593 [Rhizobium sp. BK251]